MAFHYRLPTSEVLERRVRNRIVAVLPGCHVQRDTALSGAVSPRLVRHSSVTMVAVGQFVTAISLWI